MSYIMLISIEEENIKEVKKLILNNDHIINGISFTLKDVNI